MNNIYTRNFGRRRENTVYSPPPGYDGIAFDTENMKMHEPETDISELRREAENKRRTVSDQSIPYEDDAAGEDRGEDILPVTSGKNDMHKIRQLAESLRGRLGQEELIIILVMLIVASERVGIEILLLGLLLAAG